MVWGWTPQRWEQQYFERYVPDKLARGQIPRTQPDHRVKVERLAANQGYGDAFEADVTSNGRVAFTAHDLTARRAALMGADPATRAPEPTHARTVADIGITAPPIQVPGVELTRAAFERDEPTRYRDR